MKDLLPMEQLTGLFKTYFDMLTELDGEPSEALDQVKEELMMQGEKAIEQFMFMSDVFDAYIKVCKDRANALSARIKQLTILKDLTKYDIMETMDMMNTKKVSLPEGTIIKMPGRKSLVVDDINLVPITHRNATINVSGPVAEKILEIEPKTKVEYSLNRDMVKLGESLDIGVAGVSVRVGDPFLTIRRKEV